MNYTEEQNGIMITFCYLWLCVAGYDIEEGLESVPFKVLQELVDQCVRCISTMTSEEEMEELLDRLLYICDLDNLERTTKLGGLL